MLALQQVGNLSKVYSTSYPITAGTGSSPDPPVTLKWKRMDGWIVIELIFVRIQKNMEKVHWLFVNGA